MEIEDTKSHNLTEEHNDIYEYSNQDNDYAIVLKVSKLDDNTGQIDHVQWSRIEEKQPIDDIKRKKHGLAVWVTSLFIIGEMVGGGIVSMPNAVYMQGWYGIATIIIGGLASGYTGAQLGWCWAILQERWPHVYLKHTRKPYAEMGYRVGGPFVKFLVALSVDLTLFGVATVFLILVSQNISDLLHEWFDLKFSFCYWILIVGACLIPFTMLGSPKDFWQVSLGAAGATSIAVVVMLIGVAQDYPEYQPKAKYPAPTFVNFVLGYGAIIFAYGGHSAFPTIQHDMKEPTKFPKAVFWSYSGIYFYYLPLSVLGYVVYGDVLAGDSSILTFLPPGWIQQTATALISVHVVFSFIIVANPVNQEIEQWFKIPMRFTWKRFVIRTLYMCLIIFAAESMPSFGMILDLIGGTTIAAMTFVYPGWFHLALRYGTKTGNSKFDKPIRWWEWPLNFIIITVGVLGGIASMYAAVTTIIYQGNQFQKPCYLSSATSNATNCS